MVKRIILLFILVIMLVGIASAEGNAFGIDWTQYSDDEIKWYIAQMYKAIGEAQAELDARELNESYTYQIPNAVFDVRFYSFKNSWKDDCILIEYKWKNTSNDAISFSDTIITHVFQDGREIDDTVIPSYKMGGERDKIQPATKATNYKAFKLLSDSDITIMISDKSNKMDVTKSIVIPIRVSDLKPYEE